MPQRKVVLYIATSLDGYVAREHGEIDWLFTDQDYGYTEFLQSIDTVLMGRKTYDQVLTFGDFPYKEQQCYVFTRNKEVEKAEYVDYIHEDVILFTRKILNQTGRNIWLVGGSEVIQSFILSDLIDSYIVSIHPILLGKGIPLFKGGYDQLTLKLKEVKQFDSGLVQLSYGRS